MASHSRHSRRPADRITRPPLTSRTTARAALSLALVSAASVSLLGRTAQAEPGPAAPADSADTAGSDGAPGAPGSVAQVRAEVDALYRKAEAATQQYDGARQKADAARSAVTDLQAELARKTAGMNATRDELGGIAAAQYRSGTLDPTLQLALSSSPETYLDQIGALDRIGDRQAAALARLAGQRRDIEQTRAEADGKLASLKAAQTTLASRKHTVQSELRRAQALLASLTPAQRATVDPPDGTDIALSDAAATRGTSRTPLGTDAAPSARAARAVAFAYRAIGLPYVWGATGPGAYDCSGLTQAAWKAAGVSLPRTTYTQINAGTRVGESELRPGDLVFFYSGISHVGLYIGHGEMIHAPHPGAPVQIAPVSEMPFAGATRPA
ncbi:Cell wall-associated hydrolase, NlpC family [Actinacidiphila yanglinensis]|uniref:Cell wall-associated hydrolase, NlpC family n=1 Tax=Actinacidiphila yanglinensis TaxID=310779 RepID=A0A1H6BPZ6_9ACTN|nr:C40 family peptidase [Actinacidiphila yanglinensis]SEG62754.1 Cell wall-associated hydrolase, NlpC family [Actinacidiphila yanglinensis]